VAVHKCLQKHKPQTALTLHAASSQNNDRRSGSAENKRSFHINSGCCSCYSEVSLDGRKVPNCERGGLCFVLFWQRIEIIFRADESMSSQRMEYCLQDHTGTVANMGLALILITLKLLSTNCFWTARDIKITILYSTERKNLSLPRRWLGRGLGC
jgi:hypothetical protein